MARVYQYNYYETNPGDGFAPMAHALASLFREIVVEPLSFTEIDHGKLSPREIINEQKRVKELQTKIRARLAEGDSEQALLFAMQKYPALSQHASKFIQAATKIGMES